MAKRLVRIARDTAARIAPGLAAKAWARKRGFVDLIGAVDVPMPVHRFGADIPVVGWAGSLSGRPVRVRCLMEGHELIDVEPRVTRADVVVWFPRLNPSTGFSTRILRPPLPDRPSYELVVEAYNEYETLVIGRVQVPWVPQAEVPATRADYRKVWDHVATTKEETRTAVAGYFDEAEWNRTGEVSSDMLRRVLDIGPDDVVLEVGCGSGRVGRFLAAHCKTWIGGDISAAMIEHARTDLAGIENIELRTLNGSDLRDIESNSINCAYSTVVFMHLDEWDRYRYVTEMYRALAPGGRVYVDNYNLLSDKGWAFFSDVCALDPLIRPLNVSKSSTPSELVRYVEKAGFENVVAEEHGLFVAVTGRKAGSAT